GDEHVSALVLGETGAELPPPREDLAVERVFRRPARQQCDRIQVDASATYAAPRDSAAIVLPGPARIPARRPSPRAIVDARTRARDVGTERADRGSRDVVEIDARRELHAGRDPRHVDARRRCTAGEEKGRKR